MLQTYFGQSSFIHWQLQDDLEEPEMKDELNLSEHSEEYGNCLVGCWPS